ISGIIDDVARLFVNVSMLYNMNKTFASTVQPVSPRTEPLFLVSSSSSRTLACRSFYDKLLIYSFGVVGVVKDEFGEQMSLDVESSINSSLFCVDSIPHPLLDRKLFTGLAEEYQQNFAPPLWGATRKPLATIRSSTFSDPSIELLNVLCMPKKLEVICRQDQIVLSRIGVLRWSKKCGSMAVGGIRIQVSIITSSTSLRSHGNSKSRCKMTFDMLCESGMKESLVGGNLVKPRLLTQNGTISENLKQGQSDHDCC
ncbi:hypothetical protein Tco_1111316, partial [Tanacetum coccineum]